MLVVLLHAIDVVDGYPKSFVAGFLPQIPNFNDFGASGVDLFFIISGFAMSASIDGGGRSSWQFLRQRLIRIVPLYWLSAGLLAVLSAALGRQNAYNGLWNILTILPLTPNGQYEFPALYVGWTLTFEFIFYAMVAVTFALRPNKPLLLLAAITAFFAVLPVPFDGPVLVEMVFNPIFAEFLLGILAYDLWRRQLSRETAYMLIAMGIIIFAAQIIVGVGISINVHFEQVIYGESGMNRTIMWGLPWFAILVGIVSTRRTAPAPLRRLGDASYSIYLTHLFIITAAQEMIVRMQGMSPYIAVGSIIIAAVTLGLIVHRWIETPLLIKLNTAKYKPRLMQSSVAA